MKVRLSDCDILRSSRNWNAPTIHSSFGRVFINKNILSTKAGSEAAEGVHDVDVRLRNGKLFHGSIVRDCVDFSNQLF